MDEVVPSKETNINPKVLRELKRLDASCKLEAHVIL